MSSQAWPRTYAGALSGGRIGCSFSKADSGGFRATSARNHGLPRSSTIPVSLWKTPVKNWRGSPGRLLVRVKTSGPGGSRSDSVTARGDGSVKYRVPLTLHPKGAELTERFRDHAFPYMRSLCRSAPALTRNGVDDDQFVQETMLRA
jgi:hypothetical protein